MSFPLESFIAGASNVCFRYYQFEPDMTYNGRLEYFSRAKMNEYLGEFDLNIEFSDDEQRSLLDVLLAKLSEENILDFQCLRQNLIAIGTAQGPFKELLSSKRTSLVIYQLLCYVCLSKERVGATRMLYKILDDCEKISRRYTNVSSGGQVEGLNIPDGDYDLMTILEQIYVYPKGSSTEAGKPCLIYSTDNTYPGFAHLMIPPSRFSDDLCKLWGVCSEFGTVVSNRLFKAFFAGKYRSEHLVHHGPCFSTKSGNIDHLFCLRGRTWPQVAQQLIDRIRFHEWPSTDIISNAVNQGILFVPIGSKFGAEEDCCIEWRISFTLPEMELIHSFNHIQLLCYTFVKYIKKDLIEKTISGKLLCSYFIKTTLFWVCEEYSEVFWTPDNIIDCLYVIRQRLIYWIRYGFCPHYFIPENNLFEGMLTGELQMQVEFLLSNFMTLVLQSTHYGSSFEKFSFTALHNYNMLDNTYADKNKAIFILLRIIRNSLTMCTSTQILGIISKSLYRLLHNKFSYFPKGLYQIVFCYANQIYPQLFQKVNCKKKNKTKYLHYKSVTAHLLIGTKVDLMTGWLILSYYFCTTNQYKKALKIIEPALITGLEDKMLVADGLYEDIMIKYLDDVASISLDRTLSFRKQMNTSCIELLYLVPGSSFCLDELLPDVRFKFGMIPPVIFAHFLRFVCFKRMGNNIERDNAIRDIIVTCRSNCFLGDYKGRVTAYAILAKSYLSIGDRKAADYWTLHTHRLWTEIKLQNPIPNFDSTFNMLYASL